MHISHRPYLRIGLLLCSVLYTQHSGGGSKPSAQASSPQVQQTAQPTIPMLDEGKGLIHLDISVTKADGEPVSGLTREDFELLDEGLPQKILSFHALRGRSAGREPPVQVILFFDTLCRTYPSCLSKADALRAQAGIEAFVGQDNGHLHQPVSIFGISDEGLWTVPHHDPTDGNALASDLSSGKRIVLDRRSDALHALAYIATTQRRKRGRKVMLWIGPGCGKGTGIFPASHNEGQKTFDPIYWFTTLFREARMSMDELPVDQERPCVPGYELYLNGPRTVHEANDRFLYKKVLAIQSGGRVANDTNDLLGEMNRCLSSSEFLHSFFRSFRCCATSRVPQSASASGPAGIGRAHQHRLLRRALLLRPAECRFDRDIFRETAEISQQALVAVAGLSAFLGQPPAEIQNRAAPDAAAKQHMLVLVKDYLARTISKLPDFYATRTTVQYEEMPEQDNGKNSAAVHPLRVVEQSKARVLYRDGDEAVESQDFESLASERLTTHGTFGPILADVRHAIETPDRMKWLRWESGPEGSRGVFGFEVPAAESTYFEGGCCLPDADGQDSFRIQAGYRGEIAINPEDGTIFRLQQQFDMQEYVPMDRDEVLVDYGPVKIGGKTYFCPSRSMALARGRSIISAETVGSKLPDLRALFHEDE